MADRYESRGLESPNQVGLKFDLDWTTRFVVVAAALIAAVQIAVGLLQGLGLDSRLVTLFEFFDAHGELTFNAWFSSLVIAAAAIAALAAARAVSTIGLRRRMVLSSVLLAYLSLDKATGLSAYLGRMLPRFIDVGNWRWITIGVVIAIGLVSYLVGLFRELPRPARVGLGVGGMVFVLGAVILDSLGSGSTPAVDLTEVAEELAETLGMVIIARTLFLVVRDGVDGFSTRDVFSALAPKRL